MIVLALDAADANAGALAVLKGHLHLDLARGPRRQPQLFGLAGIEELTGPQRGDALSDAIDHRVIELDARLQRRDGALAELPLGVKDAGRGALVLLVATSRSLPLKDHLAGRTAQRDLLRFVGLLIEDHMIAPALAVALESRGVQLTSLPDLILAGDAHHG